MPVDIYLFTMWKQLVLCSYFAGETTTQSLQYMTSAVYSCRPLSQVVSARLCSSWLHFWVLSSIFVVQVLEKDRNNWLFLGISFSYKSNHLKTTTKKRPNVDSTRTEVFVSWAVYLAVVSTSQLKSPGLESSLYPETFCVEFPPCLRGFSLGTPASSHNPKTIS